MRTLASCAMRIVPAASATFLLCSLAAGSEYREFRDWTVLCSSGLTCTMQFADYEATPVRSIAIERISEPHAPLSLIVGLAPDGDGGAAREPEGEIVLSIDGDDVGRFSLEEAAFDEELQAWRFDAPAGIDAILDAMKAGNEMEAALSDEGSLDVSLAGVVASLIFIDERQGRVDRADALERIGDGAVPDTAAAYDIASLADLPDAIRPDFADDGACSFYGDDSMARGIFGLDRGYAGTLIAAPCGPGGAYNQPFMLYWGDGETMHRMSFPVMDTAGPSLMQMAYNLDYSAVEDSLTSFFRGRGIGDCGGYYVWQIGEDGMGATLTLLEQREKGDCDGDYAGGPQEWPAVWPTSQ
jgi:hypothetical protein